MFLSIFCTTRTTLWRPSTSEEHGWKVDGTRLSADAYWALHIVDTRPGPNGTEELSRVPVVALPMTSYPCAGLVQLARCAQRQGTLRRPLADRHLRQRRSHTNCKPPEICQKPPSGATGRWGVLRREPCFKQKPCHVVNVPKRNLYIFMYFCFCNSQENSEKQEK